MPASDIRKVKTERMTLSVIESDKPTHSVGTSILPELNVRDLVWHEDDSRTFGTLVARTAVGEFVIRRGFIDQRTFLDTPVPDTIAPIACGGTEDAKKRAKDVLRQIIGGFLVDDTEIGTEDDPEVTV